MVPKILQTFAICTFLCSAGVATASENCTSIDQVSDVIAHHAEGPHWKADQNCLYWVDISGQVLYRLDYETNVVTKRDINYGPVSLVVPVAGSNDTLVVAVRAELYLLHWGAAAGDEALHLLTAVDVGLPDNRINDGKVDRNGRLWFGTIGKEVDGDVELDEASLYLLRGTSVHTPEIKVRPVSVSNGIVWSRDDNLMFYNDSPTKKVMVFDYNAEKATISNGRTIFDLAANKITGLPDGMTIDVDDNLWVAVFNGGAVLKIDSRAGTLLNKYTLPVSKVSSVCWGGPGLDVLFVTSSRRDLTPEELAMEPQAGAVFAISNTGARGLTANEFAFNDLEYN